MKWLFRGVLLIFLVFAGLCAAGYFLPATQSVERSIEIDAFPEEVFPYLNDLQNYSQWSALHAAIADAEIIYGGASDGPGQSMAWQGSRGDFPNGSQEIIASHPGEFVQVDVLLSGRRAKATHAIMADPNGGSLIVLTKSDIDLGGFPYLGRISGKLGQASREQQFDEALQRLKTVVEAEAG